MARKGAGESDRESTDSSNKSPKAPLPHQEPQLRFLNREISDLQFVQRVADESMKQSHPLLERIRFLGIAASVLEQFYTARLAKLNRTAHHNQQHLSTDGLSLNQQLDLIRKRAEKLELQLQAYWLALKSALAEESIGILESEDLNQADLNWLLDYFKQHILHAITPFTLDEEHPFPFIPSTGICAVLEFDDHSILIPLPSNLPRFISLPGKDARFIRLETLYALFWKEIIPNDQLQGFGLFQVLRDNELALEERAADLRTMIESGLQQRDKANVTLLKFSETTTEDTMHFIANGLGMDEELELGFRNHPSREIKESHFIYIESLVGISTIAQLIKPISGRDYHGFLFDSYKARYPQRILDHNGNLFETVTAKDLLVHWPYESFDVVIHFLQQAARDPDVLAIKQTLYRTSDDSPIVQSLVEAAENGKAVTVVIELEARDNEASNVQLAKRLEIAGAQIVYGIIGLKIHCKATLITRREGDRTALYSHLGTGNYHPENAKIYTDLSFFTKDQEIGEDVSRVFNYLTSNRLIETRRLIVSPKQLRKALIQLIETETENAEKGLPASIWIKVNSLTDPKLIEKLYTASSAGVKIELIVRRHCCLIPGLAGLSDNIRVCSIVGRFLEHARIYCFANAGEMKTDSAKIFMGSADWMERNLDDRVEIMLPIEDPTIRQQILEQIMTANIHDNRQSWYLGSDGEYYRDENCDDSNGFCAQTWFMQTSSHSGLGSKKDSAAIEAPRSSFSSST